MIHVYSVSFKRSGKWGNVTWYLVCLLSTFSSSSVVTNLSVYIPVVKQVGLTHLTCGIPRGLRSQTCHSPLLTDRLWGSTVCTTCKGFCSGHYSPPTYNDVTNPVAIKSFARPPSSVLKELFCQQNWRFCTVYRSTCSSPQSRSEDTECFCGVCSAQYCEETAEM